MKRVIALILAILMVASLSVVVSAADASKKEKSYLAYQVFSGTQAPGEAKLASVAWGNGINGEALLAALKADKASFGSLFNDCVTAEDVARVIAEFTDDGDLARAFARNCCKNKIGSGTPVSDGNGSMLDAGYYIIYDATEYADDDTNYVYNLSLLQVTNKGIFEIKEKVTVPEVEKEVYEESTDEWQEAADYDIGDSVPFRLTATVGKIKGYKCYPLTFHDHLSKGLSFDPSTLKVTVTIQHKGGYEQELYAGQGLDKYKLTIIDERNFDVTINDLITLEAEEGDKVFVTYSAVLNEDAVVGTAGNPNTVKLDYYNNPNDECGGDKGETPEEEVIVYTWGDQFDKVTETNGELLPLAGAKFELFKKNADGSLTSLGEKEVVEVKDAETGKIISYSANFKGLDSGSYVLRETVVPAGYNGIDDIEFTVIATFDGKDVKEFKVDNGFEAKEGTVYGEILNKVGVVLPETGGAGTKALTAVGATALICGLVFGITKKRAGEED